MGFFSSLFGGPSAEEVAIAGQQHTFATTMQGYTEQQFAGLKDVQQRLQGLLNPVTGTGQGFSPQELAARNTYAMNLAASNARFAMMRTGSDLAGAGRGGASALPSGVRAQIMGSEASAAQAALSNELLNIQSQDYATGRDIWKTKIAGTEALAHTYDPLGFGKETTTGLSGAMASATQIQKERQAAAAGIFKLGAGILGGGLSFATGGLSNLATGGGWSNIGRFFSGGLHGGPTAAPNMPSGGVTSGGMDPMFTGGMSALSGPPLF